MLRSPQSMSLILLSQPPPFVVDDFPEPDARPDAPTKKWWPFGDGSKPCTPVVHIKIAAKWMFIPLNMVLIGIDPYPFKDRDS